MTARQLSCGIALVVFGLGGTARAQDEQSIETYEEVEAAPVAAPVERRASPEAQRAAATDAGWNKEYAALFSLNNIFTASGVLSAFAGGIGAEYFLDRQSAVRAMVFVSRSSTPATVTRNTLQNGDQEVVTFDVTAPAQTSSGAVIAEIDLLHRVIRSAFAPYLGAGLTFGWAESRQSFVDDVTIEDQVTTVKNRTSAWSVGLRGIGGAEWRLHSNVSLFAEYQLSVDIFRMTDVDNVRKVEVTTPSGESTVTRQRSESSTPAWLNLDTSLAHGGQLGLAIHF